MKTICVHKAQLDQAYQGQVAFCHSLLRQKKKKKFNLNHVNTEICAGKFFSVLWDLEKAYSKILSYKSICSLI